MFAVLQVLTSPRGSGAVAEEGPWQAWWRVLAAAPVIVPGPDRSRAAGSGRRAARGLCMRRDGPGPCAVL